MYNHTTLHPLGLLAVVVMGIATLVLPRRYAVVPFLVVACFISPAQRIVIATLDFNLLRVMVLFGWARVLARGETRGFTWRWMDTLLVLWTLAGTAIMALREGTAGALVYRLGLTYDAAGMYFLFRLLIRDWDDVKAIVVSAAVLSLPVAAVFLLEQATGRNMFAIFGGVPAITEVRDGKLRCRGPFAHPIFAGCFWAALMPLFGALWWSGRRSRWLAPVALAASTVVIFATASATSMGALLVAGLAVAMYPLRRYVAWMRWAGVLCLIGLHLVMIKPVWHLLARIHWFSGTGWYRYKLIDEFVRRFGEWWLLGTSSYEDWWQYRFEAVTNHYVLEAVGGGLITLVLFVAFIAVAFRGAGRLIRATGGNRYHRMTAWAIGASLLVHCASFIGVAYFGQVFVVWYIALAGIASLQTEALVRRVRVVAVRAPASAAERPGLAPSMS